MSRGRAHATRSLTGAWGLAWRLTMPTVLGWALAAFVLAAAYGTAMNYLADFVLSNSVYQQLAGVDPGSDDATGAVGLLMLTMAILSVIPVLITANRLVREERAGHLDYLLARTVSRERLFVGYAWLAVVVAVGMSLATAAGFWLASAVLAIPVEASLVFMTALNYLAGTLAFAGLGLFLAGVAKRASWIGWGYLGVTFLAVYLGGVLNMPRQVQRFTPFGFLQHYPAEPFLWWRWLALVAAALVLAIIGLLGYGRRDVTPKFTPRPTP